MWYNITLSEVLEKLSADRQKGLDSAKAKELLEQYGENKLTAKKKKTLLQRFLMQFADFMVIILMIAAVISFIIALNGHDKSEFLEPIIILVIVLLNATLGVVQESKAEKALEALQNMSSPNAKVIRDGVTVIIPSSQVVPGDIILMEAGDFIPADARLLDAASLKCEESALTGESVAVDKDAQAQIQDNAPLGDRLNMVYSGCSVAYGRASAVVTATGMDTEMGKIATLLEGENDAQTPLQQKLTNLGKILGVLALAICAVIFVIGFFSGMEPLNIFMTSVSLAVAAIPEGLPAIVTIVLAMGVQRMVKRNAIIRRLPAVETLGSASVICSDKTGTLTQNRMTLTKAWAGNGEPVEITNQVPEDILALLRLSTLCTDGKVEIVDGAEQHMGDPTETAIVAAALKNGIVKNELNTSYPRISEIPFDSDRKLMTTVHVIDGKNYVIVKGAFDVLAARCVNGDLEKAKIYNETMAKQALRVLAVAFKVVEEVPAIPTSDKLETGLTFVGLLGMIDPPREEAAAAVETCIKAGIKTVMITGDHVVTASAIARQLGILKDDSEGITGAQLDAMSDEELAANIRNYSVYARVSPENKIRIVKAWQQAGEIVSMTGDGVNDAPALKAADIGCAMGITGTDVAKGAADMTLTDDNFATIVEAVREGRGIYDNIKKAVQFLLSCNIGEVLTVFIAMIVWHAAPLVAMQLLWINLVTDGLPALALGMEPAEDDIMERKPKHKGESIFADGLGLRIVLQGIMFAVLTLFAFFIGIGFKFTKLTPDELLAGQTMAFMVLAVSQLFHVYNIRTSHSLLKVGIKNNKYLLGAFFCSFTLIALIVFIPPLASIFGLVMLPVKYYLYALGLSFSPIIIVELAKLSHVIVSKLKK